ncbi:hypothetical protein BJ912DRAFT_1060287 [Pholiota molesta]|nr:hypothetical protein BJ912DRAFT_1060287 [Pholiota molesta]
MPQNLPSPILANADFLALLRVAIDLEDECTETLPGAIPFGPEMQQHSPAIVGQTQSRQHKKRCRTRNAKIQSLGYRPKIRSAKKHLKSAQIINTALNASTLPVSTGAHTALNRPVPPNPSKVSEIEELIADGFIYVSCGENGSPQPIVDCNGLIVAHIAGSPPDTSYDEDCMKLFNVIIEESSSDTFKKAELNHKRGEFPAVNFGFTLPNGFKHPINLDMHYHEQKIKRISSCLGFKRISAFQNAAFAFWNPGVYDYQKSRIEQLLAHDTSLQRTSPKTIFPTTACNFRNAGTSSFGS